MSDPSPTDDWFPRHPALRPGLRLVHRDDGRLQLGLHAGDRLLLPDDPHVHAVLAAVRAGRRPALDSPGPRRWARELVARGAVVDASALARTLGGGLPRATVLAAWTRPDAPARLAARAAARVAVRADAPWAAVVHELLDQAGLRIAAAAEPATVALVVADRGEPPRDSLDEWLRVGMPHLLVRNVAARVEVGPLVAPGLTACLRCVDAHEEHRDADHGLLVDHHAPADDEPADPLLLRLALTWAVRDVLAYVEGDEPSTWSASVALDAGLAARRTAWLRHPHCGCAWGDVLATRPGA